MRFNRGYEYRERLGRDADGQSLLSYLSRRHRHSSAAEWAERIATGHVTVNDRLVAPETVLRQGATLVWRRPPWIEPDAPRSFTILYEDEDLLAVAKPAGLPTLPGANFLETTLLYQVHRHAPDAAPMHRLGRWTSGIVLCARNRNARRQLMLQWTTHQVLKRYRALAVGCPEFDQTIISFPIGPVPHALLGTLHAIAVDGKPSLSRVTVRERRAASFLCEVCIATGRPHQIRIHLAAVGHPLVGDPLYGAGGVPSADTHALPGDPGYRLHAAELRVRHPRSGGELTITCDPPSWLRRLTDTS